MNEFQRGKQEVLTMVAFKLNWTSKKTYIYIYQNTKYIMRKDSALFGNQQ